MNGFRRSLKDTVPTTLIGIGCHVAGNGEKLRKEICQERTGNHPEGWPEAGLEIKGGSRNVQLTERSIIRGKLRFRQGGRKYPDRPTKASKGLAERGRCAIRAVQTKEYCQPMALKDIAERVRGAQRS